MYALYLSHNNKEQINIFNTTKWEQRFGWTVGKMYIVTNTKSIRSNKIFFLYGDIVVPPGESPLGNTLAAHVKALSRSRRRNLWALCSCTTLQSRVIILLHYEDTDMVAVLDIDEICNETLPDKYHLSILGEITVSRH